MKDLKTIQVAQQLTKNLMWLERSNPLLSIEELKEEGIRMSGRIAEQYGKVKDLWDAELGKMKSLEIILRYLVGVEMDTICATMKAPKVLPRGRVAHSRQGVLATLGSAYSSDLSSAMRRGRAEELGGGSRRGLHIA